MINLAPDTYKTEIRAARANVLLIRYICILSIAIIVLGGLVGGAYVVLDASRASAQEAMNSSSLKTSRYDSIRLRAEKLRADLATAKSILDQKVSYTKLIHEIASSLPSGVVLSTLDLDPATFGSEMTINASARDFKSASQLESKLASKSTLFSSVKLLSMETGEAGDNSGDNSSVPGYPVHVSVSVVINKEALK